MKTTARRVYALAATAALLIALPLGAAVKTQEKTKAEFPGMLGGMMRFIGGKAAKEGVINSTALRGNRLLTVNDKNGQLIDLDEEKIYEIDFDKKRYKVTTFEEYRRRMQEAQQKMAEAAKNHPSQPQQPSGQPAKEMDIDFNVKETGQTQTLNGYNCRQLVMTITMREKGKTLEQSGGIVTNADMWMGPQIPEMKEVADFHRRYAEKIGLLSFNADTAAQMAMAQSMYPGMQKAMEKFRTESADMSGTAILTVMKMDTVPSPEQRAQVQQQQHQQPQQEDSATPTSIGGLLGGFGRKMGKKTVPKDEAPSADGRASLMTTTTELLSVSTSVADSDVSIPAGFKEDK